MHAQVRGACTSSAFGPVTLQDSVYAIAATQQAPMLRQHCVSQAQKGHTTLLMDAATCGSSSSSSSSSSTTSQRARTDVRTPFNTGLV